MWTNKKSGTLEHGNIKLDVTVRNETTIDYYTELALFRQMFEMIEGRPYTAADYMSTTERILNDLASLIVRTEVVDGLPKKMGWASKDSDKSQLCKAYETFIQLPRPITRAWIQIMNEANQPPGDPDLYPMSADEEKEIDPESAKKETA